MNNFTIETTENEMKKFNLESIETVYPKWSSGELGYEFLDNLFLMMPNVTGVINEMQSKTWVKEEEQIEIEGYGFNISFGLGNRKCFLRCELMENWEQFIHKVNGAKFKERVLTSEMMCWLLDNLHHSVLDMISDLNVDEYKVPYDIVDRHVSGNTVFLRFHVLGKDFMMSCEVS